MSTDERRARAIMDAMDTYNIDEPIRHYLARAIRASDEVAGMVLVPREAIDRMIIAGANAQYPMGPEEVWRAMIAAATESDNG